MTKNDYDLKATTPCTDTSHRQKSKAFNRFQEAVDETIDAFAERRCSEAVFNANRRGLTRLALDKMTCGGTFAPAWAKECLRLWEI